MSAIRITFGPPRQPIRVTLRYGSTGEGGGTGPAGPANTLTIGTVTTGSAGSSAAATITGTAPNQTLNLTIPTGATGSTGSAGPANTLTIGTVTTGSAGSSAAATITGSAPNQTLNLTIPTGATGATGSTGSTGSAGPANTLTIGTVTTGSAGSSAAATITGTAPNQTLNLTIPRGDTGADGGSSIPDGSITAPKLAAGVVWKQVWKTEATSRSYTTTLAEDPHLVVPIGANQTLHIKGTVFFDTAATPDIKFGHTSPSGATVRLYRKGIGGGGTALTGIVVDTANLTAGAALAGSGASGVFEFYAVVENGSTAGNVALTWAQNTSDAANTTVRAWSLLEYLEAPSSSFLIP